MDSAASDAAGLLAFGAAVGLGQAAVPPAAFAGAVGATALLFVVTGLGGRVSSTALLLTGVVFNAFASAAIVFIASLAGLAEGASIFLWLIGNLSGGDLRLATWVFAFLGLGLACALPLARGLNLLALVATLVVPTVAVAALGEHLRRNGRRGPLGYLRLLGSAPGIVFMYV